MTYCVKCKTNTNNIDSKIFRTKNNRLLMQPKCSNCKNKKSRLVKEQEAKGLLSDLGINTPFRNFFFECFVLNVKNEWNY